MAASVEGRVPYLDQPLVEFGAALPLETRFEGAPGKRLLRVLARRHLPPEITERAKHGFSAPVEQWLRGPLDELVGDAFSGTGSGVFHMDVLRRWHDEHRAGRDRAGRAVGGALLRVVVADGGLGDPRRAGGGRAAPEGRGVSGRPLRVLHVITRMIVGGAQENTMLSCALIDPRAFPSEVAHRAADRLRGVAARGGATARRGAPRRAHAGARGEPAEGRAGAAAARALPAPRPLRHRAHALVEGRHPRPHRRPPGGRARGRAHGARLVLPARPVAARVPLVRLARTDVRALVPGADRGGGGRPRGGAGARHRPPGAVRAHPLGHRDRDLPRRRADARRGAPAHRRARGRPSSSAAWAGCPRRRRRSTCWRPSRSWRAGARTRTW